MKTRGRVKKIDLSKMEKIETAYSVVANDGGAVTPDVRRPGAPTIMTVRLQWTAVAEFQLSKWWRQARDSRKRGDMEVTSEPSAAAATAMNSKEHQVGVGGRREEPQLDRSQQRREGSNTCGRTEARTIPQTWRNCRLHEGKAGDGDYHQRQVATKQSTAVLCGRSSGGGFFSKAPTVAVIFQWEKITKRRRPHSIDERMKRIDVWI